MHIRSIGECPYSNSKEGFKTVVIDKTGNKKLNDGFDQTRDLLSYSAKYDENKNLLIRIKLEKYQQEAFDKNSSIVILLDFLKDYGTYLLPFNIKGATDHWWEIAYNIKNKNVTHQISENIPYLEVHQRELLKESLEVTEINSNTNEITLKLNLDKLKELGWYPRFPLYLQILTAKGELITDSFNDPKPYENANFLVGAMPINKFLEYNSKCLIISH